MNLTCCMRAMFADIGRGGALGATLASVLLAAMCSPAIAQPSFFGEWNEPLSAPKWPGDGIAMHAVHLSTGRILVWKYPDEARLWNPADDSITEVHTAFQIDCSGHAALADGSILLAGGGAEDGDPGPPANDQTTIYSLRAVPNGPWVEADTMDNKRFYPTCTTLPDGRVLAISGKNEIGVPVETPEIYDPGLDMWQPMNVSADKALPNYPWMFVLPDDGLGDTRVFYAGAGTSTNTYILNIDSQTWSDALSSNISAHRGAAVMYEHGGDVWVLKSGGNWQGGITDLTDVINLNDLNPSWALTPVGMVEARRRHRLVLLPDGTILAVGGERIATTSAAVVPVKKAELFDPEVAAWTEMAEMSNPRARHGIAVLLADGRVLSAGGQGHDPEGTVEIYSPRYLFTGQPRPSIGYAPTVVQYGSGFRVLVNWIGPQGAGAIQKVSLVRPAAVTHWFDEDQRFVDLEFLQVTDAKLNVTAPADASRAPPGYYMLFIISNAGVPSVARYLRLE